ncbi:MAG: DNA-binding protein [Candidatus Aenigmarchaeota archaeon]|nr:DNA-binding protein [Candidatus Aenigmarchaeota archaeon]
MSDDEAAIKKNILSRMLSKEAHERLSRVRSVKPEFAAQLESYMVSLFQSGQIKTEITDDQLKQILDKVSQKKQFNIRRA